ncbi:MAG: hypothetical protein A2X46_09030 [Lentisphaerae bacterium GWF2_57_35]|nr:MAG: hypothetical protein A2X46_09030 [Lentisphaerae bacterium GWF2_57_35]
MFGELAVYCDSKIVALACDNRLFVKPTRAGQGYIGEVVEVPSYPGAKLYLRMEWLYFRCPIRKDLKYSGGFRSVGTFFFRSRRSATLQNKECFQRKWKRRYLMTLNRPPVVWDIFL